MQMRDPDAGDDMDFARFKAENIPGLVHDENEIGWDTYLMGWQAQF